MSFKILSHEIQRAEARSHMSIRTTVPREEIDDKGLIILPRLRGSGLSAGDHILVQCMNLDSTELFAEADFVIASVRTEQRQVTGEDDREFTSKEVTYKLVRRSEWWSPAGIPKPVKAPVAA